MDTVDSQCEQILQYLKSGNSITPLEALNDFKCMRLAAIVHLLKKPKYGGHNIKTEMIKVASGKRVASYKLLGQLEIT